MTFSADVCVRSGSTLRISSSGAATLVVGKHQLRVGDGAELRLERMVVADSELSSALLSDGTFTAIDCTFLRCATTTNAVVVLAEAFVPGGAGAFLAAAGGAVFSRGATTIEGSTFLPTSWSAVRRGRRCPVSAARCSSIVARKRRSSTPSFGAIL